MKNVSKIQLLALSSLIGLNSSCFGKEKTFWQRYKQPIIIAATIVATAIVTVYATKPVYATEPKKELIAEPGFFSRVGNWLADHTHLVFGGMYHMGGSTPVVTRPKTPKNGGTPATNHTPKRYKYSRLFRGRR